MTIGIDQWRPVVIPPVQAYKTLTINGSQHPRAQRQEKGNDKGIGNEPSNTKEWS